MLYRLFEKNQLARFWLALVPGPTEPVPSSPWTRESGLPGTPAYDADEDD